MTFVPAIGESDFRKLRELGAGYVDKSDFISQVLGDMSSVLLFPAQRTRSASPGERRTDSAR